MTVTIDLPAAVYEPLAKLAQRNGSSAEELAGSVLAEYVRANGAGPPALDPAVAAAVADSVRENDELYRRLAK